MVTRPLGVATAGLLLLALDLSHAQEPPQPLVFTRPTIVATVVDGTHFFHDLIFEDETLRFVGRHYGSGGKYTPGLFVHRKADDRWLQILELSTEHARLGPSPDFDDIALSVGWNYSVTIQTPTLPDIR